ncbi:adenylate/guanylate cyclase domain-containing protein [Mycolicibacterium sp. 120270]|uniref:adenylate/guanylate cyclase domain-containing protein n=1 Tax=Mycolicibacterium sp. 120270 TaxID=3090600 RepID=UPI00299F3DC7|nr:adenylate/guanylate cyclase domain-containing protein [Mycolicibacterium sp. 120270]MDX1886791.1 adenylate/guanylate cyclase domain-containing protein [Mycolicibacterium sp. 120270]
MAQAPRTRYAKCGDLDIAYQVLGDGPDDLVVLPGALVAFDWIESEPALYRFHNRLASFARVIRLDQRGMGSSSRPRSNDLLGPRFWAEDAVAVMDAAGCEQATIFGSGWSAMTALVLAADYPDRVKKLVLVNGAARVTWAPDYPIGAQISGSDPWKSVALDPDAFEQGFDVLRIIGPSVADDANFRRWWDLAGNRSQSPSEASALVDILLTADVRDTFTRITAPTLIMHRKDAVMIPADRGHYIAEHIPHARYIELPGADTLHWTGDAAPILDEIEEFVTGARSGSETERMLTTILFTDIVGSTVRAAELGDLRWHDLLDNHDRIVRSQLQRFSGREVNTAGDGFVATFTSPSVAIACAEAIVEAVRPLGIEIRAGIHAGEVELRGADIAGMAVHICARVGALAGAGEVLVSSTVREIVTGSRRTFSDRGEHDLKGVPGRWRIYAV